jgi:uncharacterized protein YjbI with pentapeptide repeats
MNLRAVLLLFVLALFAGAGLAQTDPRLSVLDANWYLAKYPDLRTAFGNNVQAVQKHWLEFGIREGRQPAANFELQSYVARYPDLQRAYGKDYAAILNHWIQFGQREGRAPHPALPAQSLIRNPADGGTFLIDATGARRWIMSANVFAGCGLDWGQAINVYPGTVTAFPAGANLDTVDACRAARSGQPAAPVATPQPAAPPGPAMPQQTSQQDLIDLTSRGPAGCDSNLSNDNTINSGNPPMMLAASARVFQFMTPGQFQAAVDQFRGANDAFNRMGQQQLWNLAGAERCQAVVAALNTMGFGGQFAPQLVNWARQYNAQANVRAGQTIQVVGGVAKARRLADNGVQDCRLATDTVCEKLLLAGIAAPGVVMARSTFNGSNLSKANLAGANLAASRFFQSDLTGANLANADLTGTILTGAKLDGVNLAGARLDGATMPDGSMCGRNSIGGCKAVRTVNRCMLEPGTSCEGYNLSNADLRNLNLSGASLRLANLSGADLSGSQLVGADLSGANLRGAKLSGTVIYGAILAQTTWVNGATCGALNKGACFPARLVGGCLAESGADCSANVIRAGSLRNGDFSNLNLTKVNFEGTDLSGADFSGADITLANFWNTRLDGAKFSGTRFRDTGEACVTGSVGRACAVATARVPALPAPQALSTDISAAPAGRSGTISINTAGINPMTYESSGVQVVIGVDVVNGGRTTAINAVVAPAGGRVIRVHNLCGEAKSISVKNSLSLTAGEYLDIAGPGQKNLQIPPGGEVALPVAGKEHRVHHQGWFIYGADLKNDTDHIYLKPGSCDIVAGPPDSLGKQLATTLRPQVVSIENQCVRDETISIKNDDSGEYQKISGTGTDLTVRKGESSIVSLAGSKFWGHFAGLVVAGIPFNGSGRLLIEQGGAPCKLRFIGGPSPTEGSYRISSLRNADPRAIGSNFTRMVEIATLGTATPAEQALINDFLAYASANRIRAVQAAAEGLRNYRAFIADKVAVCLAKCSGADASKPWPVSGGNVARDLGCFRDVPNENYERAGTSYTQARLMFDGEEKACTFQPRTGAKNLAVLFDVGKGQTPPDDFLNLARIGVPLPRRSDAEEIGRIAGTAVGAVSAAAAASGTSIALMVSGSLFPYGASGAFLAPAMAGASVVFVPAIAAVAVVAIATPLLIDIVKDMNYEQGLQELERAYRSTSVSLSELRTTQGRNAMLLQLTMYAKGL